jgi:Flp pilus assembly pilin Flp
MTVSKIQPPTTATIQAFLAKSADCGQIHSVGRAPPPSARGHNKPLATPVTGGFDLSLPETGSKHARDELGRVVSMQLELSCLRRSWRAMRALYRFRKNTSGAAAIEYGLAVALIAITIVAVIAGSSGNLGAALDNIAAGTFSASGQAHQQKLRLAR